MKKNIATFLILFFNLNFIVAQVVDNLQDPELPKNLVSNSSFEQSIEEPCRWNSSGKDYMKHFVKWQSPTETSPDLFSTNAEPTCFANPNKHNGGKQKPRNGEKMAGLKTFGTGGTDTYWHEYLMIELDSALEKNQKYYAEFFVVRSQKGSKAANNIGMLFSDSIISTRDRLPLYFTPQINEDEIIDTKGNFWKKIKGVFTAESNAKYLLIGNFYGDNVTITKKMPEGERGAYYYIDDVAVRRALPLENETRKPIASIAPPPRIILKKLAETKEIKLDSINYQIGNRIKLSNIFFEFDKATLLPASENELNKLADILEDYPYMEIEIGGHTDNIGANVYNQNLSEQRAKAVVDFLIDKDTNQKRISYKGYGSSMPITSNEEETGRQQNRRVEFKILKN
jgi:OmpA-OmpF porin, OOP family